MKDPVNSDHPEGVTQKRDMTPLSPAEATRTRKMLEEQAANNPSPLYRKIFENALAKEDPLTVDLLSTVTPFIIETVEDLVFGLPERYAGETELLGSIDPRSGSIVIFNAQEWSNLESRVNGLPTYNRGARHFKQRILGWACEIWVEDGTIRIPLPLYEEARISRDGCITDRGTHCLLEGSPSGQSRETNG